MSTSTEPLPLTNTGHPATQEEAVALVREAYENSTALYPLGGCTSLDYGLPAKYRGWGLSLTGLNRVVDYPARDLTITVEAGITMAQLRRTLAAERQRLPIDAPEAETATLGGLIATGFSGPRRYGHGTLRDYVIGISAIDGRGVPFQGGGRVVKNVAGYDFCKLLIGSLGTLAVVTQVTLKVKPLPQATAFVACDVPHVAECERLLAALVHSRATPTAVELLSGPAWVTDSAFDALRGVDRLAIGLEGTLEEVDYQQAQLLQEWKELGFQGKVVPADQTTGLWERLTEFPAAREGLMIKASMVPSAVASFVGELTQLAADVSILAHAGNGVVLARFPSLAPTDVARHLIRTIQPAAQRAAGSVVVLWAPAGAELTRQTVWGGATAADRLMRSIKNQFDPLGMLNPGRFVY